MKCISVAKRFKRKKDNSVKKYEWRLIVNKCKIYLFKLNVTIIF